MDRARAEQLLYDEDGRATTTLRDYRRLRSEYQEAEAALRAAKAAAASQQRPSPLAPMTDAPLRRRADRAMQRWLSLGHKQQVEAALRATGRRPDDVDEQD